MIYSKTEEEIALMRKSCLLVGKTIAEIARALRPGITTASLDKLAEEFIRDHSGVPSFKGYVVHGKTYPYSTCISCNDEVVHGMPGPRVIVEGDIVSFDCGVYLNGYHGDSAYTFPIGEVNPSILTLLRVTKESLMLGIEKAVLGNRLLDISSAIQTHVESHGYSVVRELVGHGIGRQLHEKPEVPNYGKKGNGVVLKSGFTLAIEPMINKGHKEIITAKDGWTVATKDHQPSAHYEHTIAITSGKADILTTFEYIEAVRNEYIGTLQPELHG